MKKILFQGDSITDAGRSRENDEHKGKGYPTLIAAKLGLEEPCQYEFINRGISGDRVVDIYARIKRDIINLKPDVLSILVGVNDVWHELGEKNGVSNTKYKRIYGMLIDEIKEALPETKLIILEPFVLRASATEEKWDIFRSQVEDRAVSAKKIAEEKGARFVPLMKEFDRMAKAANADYWLYDGVHPTSAGHGLIAREWIKAFKALR